MLSLPRELGATRNRAQPIVAGLGRYGPYVKHGDDYRSLESEDDLFTVDLARRWRCSRQPKKAGAAGRRAAKRVIAQLEATDGGAPLELLEGRYGPYVTDGETNASIPAAPIRPTLTLEDARALIEARAGDAGEGRRPASRSKGAVPQRRRPRAAEDRRRRRRTGAQEERERARAATRTAAPAQTQVAPLT